MLFPKSRMRFTKTQGGKVDPEGWIVLDLAGIEMDGLNHLTLSMADLEAVRKAGDKATDKLKQARALLGGSEEE